MQSAQLSGANRWRDGRFTVCEFLFDVLGAYVLSNTTTGKSAKRSASVAFEPSVRPRR